jgi:hypothetical protein
LKRRADKGAGVCASHPGEICHYADPDDPSSGGSTVPQWRFDLPHLRNNDHVTRENPADVLCRRDRRILLAFLLTRLQSEPTAVAVLLIGLTIEMTVIRTVLGGRGGVNVWDEMKMPLTILGAAALFLGLIGLAMSSYPALAGVLAVPAFVVLFAPLWIGALKNGTGSSSNGERRFFTKDRVAFWLLAMASALTGFYAQFVSRDPVEAGVLFIFALLFFFAGGLRK